MYQLTADSNYIIRISDGGFIWANLDNDYYQEYLVWAAAGGIPAAADPIVTPVPVLDLSTQLAALLIANGTIAASDLPADTLADVNTQLSAAGQSQISLTIKSAGAKNG